MMPSQHVQPMRTSECGIQMAEMTYWIGLTPSMSVVINMSMIFGSALSPMMTLKDALGLGNCQIRTNISAVFMMLSLNIAELIPDQENMPKGQVAGDLKTKVQFDRIKQW
jgi:hypothetical protein